MRLNAARQQQLRERGLLRAEVRRRRRQPSTDGTQTAPG
jgi:hypothetical protein